MNKEDLLKLRDELADQVKQLALNENASGDPVVRLNVLMNLVHAGDTSREVLLGAYKAIQQLPEDAAKMDSMLDLVYEIDVALSAGDDSQENTSEDQDSGNENMSSRE